MKRLFTILALLALLCVASVPAMWIMRLWTALPFAGEYRRGGRGEKEVG